MREEPEDFRNAYTVGELLDYIEKHKIPRDGKVLIQRVEDKYFDGLDISGIRGQLPDGTYGILPEGSKSTGWDTVKREGFQYHLYKMSVDNAISGEYDDKEEYPRMTQENIDSLKNMDLTPFLDEYIIAHSPVKHDGKHLYIDAHY